ncbi:MAG: hypothetical protein EOS54_01850 [Mesorhizobium sp.]|uniref:hypothetical protein n=1 Tax=unclassified Mesorhizobium TaxID=325217 RepID=UPI000F75A1C3|nr:MULTISPECIES: hypothetical protein [unclassified Mesorhizobium]RVD74039.1 hypothetical protein EN751_01500 [Mesorhizobium sp. M4A.F.Ca.ET.029.04.2.1]AZO48822.1 hypothetical protein EJ073_14180 [Mesorhizobium sp. M4B.F.Ca.ET.058.02.1.1]RUX49700.1 hypothetical protein EOA33_11745 [Mesorhizobium sp. M4A.F.Ca.ET.050.02.1.1]RVC83859.1 hypothetical protein EN745_01055 [Mesorhizobium sp. M4A.F.Ca.ET.022.05.2.1]RVD35861.1 hypothetical protein EN742_23995 [Mesorhizobium sp. M4A.F.Ca.ET.020.02.1.1]
MQATLVTAEASAPTESSSSAVNWGPIIAGAFAASTLTVMLLLLGSGLGLSMVSPWSAAGASATTFAVSTAVWLVVVQWLSSGVGGYLTGRLRTKWVGIHTDETYFRDTAHGFLAWALATLLVAGVLGSALSAALGSGVQAVSTVAAGAATGASAGAASKDSSAFDSTSYYVDALFRPADLTKLVDANPQNEAAATAQASRILLASAANGGELAADDSAYLTQLVAARTGLPQADAKARVDAMMAKVKDAKIKAQQAADTARKAGASFALLGALSMVVGAFIASVAAALGGRQRDDEEATYLADR